MSKTFAHRGRRQGYLIWVLLPGQYPVWLKHELGEATVREESDLGAVHDWIYTLTQHFMSTFLWACPARISQSKQITQRHEEGGDEKCSRCKMQAHPIRKEKTKARTQAKHDCYPALIVSFQASERKKLILYYHHSTIHTPSENRSTNRKHELEIESAVEDLRQWIETH